MSHEYSIPGIIALAFFCPENCLRGSCEGHGLKIAAVMPRVQSTHITHACYKHWPSFVSQTLSKNMSYSLIVK